MEPGQKLVKTVSYQDFLAEAKRDPFKGFENSPIKEVRLECLKTIRERRYVYPDWAESCITALYEENDVMREDVLSWYLFSVEKNEGIIRAINFALSLRKVKDYSKRLSDDIASKFIAGKLLKGQAIVLYPQLPSLREFLVELLFELKRPYAKNKGYFLNEWHCVERALRVIVSEEDHSFLPLIGELILLHQQGIIRPYEETPFYQKYVNMAALKAAKRILSKAQKEHLAQQKS